MAGSRNGMQALIKRVAADAHWTHCVIHREALASRQLSPELNEVLTEVVNVRVFELRAEIRMFLEEERMYESASKFSDEQFLLKLAYLSDVFGKLNE
ncbi:hypothetical protein FQN60_016707, partial [Etheostoma spectabile]